jgi:tricarballylate dehydrogenase
MSGPVTERSDVVVIGAGSAGLAAAVAAADAGAERVLVLEKAERREAGGNARFSHTGFRATYAGPEEIRPFVGDLAPERWTRLELPGYSVAELARDLDTATDGQIDPGLRDRLAADSAPALHWMRELGIPWELNRSIEVDGREHFEPGLVLAVAGGGRQLIARWLELAQRRPIALRFDAAVEDVLVDEGRVRGVVVNGAGPGRRIAAEAVIVCSGGFQASERLRAKHLGRTARAAVVRGSRYDTGEVIEALLRRGAASAGSWGLAVTSPVDAASPPHEGGNRMNRYSYPFGITVDRDGRRFFDEGAGGLGDTYGAVGRQILGRPGGVAWQLFDAAGERLVKAYAYQHATPVRAESIGDLAKGAGIDPGGLERTVREFNAAARTGAAFDPSRPDGLGTVGLHPPKSNWARPLDRPPFSAYAVTGGITFTLGGLRIDAQARVLDATGEPIAGLFASGDAVGLFHGGYPSGAGQTRNVVLSRLAGAGAGAAARASRTAPAPAPRARARDRRDG